MGGRQGYGHGQLGGAMGLGRTRLFVPERAYKAGSCSTCCMLYGNRIRKPLPEDYDQNRVAYVLPPSAQPVTTLPMGRPASRGCCKRGFAVPSYANRAKMYPQCYRYKPSRQAMGAQYGGYKPSAYPSPMPAAAEPIAPTVPMGAPVAQPIAPTMPSVASGMPAVQPIAPPTPPVVTGPPAAAVQPEKSPRSAFMT